MSSTDDIPGLSPEEAAEFESWWWSLPSPRPSAVAAAPVWAACAKLYRERLRIQAAAGLHMVGADAARQHLAHEVERLQAEVERLRANGPEMERGRRGDGTVWMGAMRECLEDARQAADLEARLGDEARDELKRRRADAARLARALEPMAAIGGPDGHTVLAFPDLPQDVVLFENSGKAITVGDVRAARAAINV